MKQSLFSAIWHYLFGYRYYQVIYVSTGTTLLSVSTPYPSRQQAERSSYGLTALIPIEIVSFRSRHLYNGSQILDATYDESGNLLLTRPED